MTKGFEVNEEDTHLLEKTSASQRVFDGQLLHINRDRVHLPDGQEADREYVVHPGAVMILPILPDGQILLERQYRYPLHQVFIEFPAGKAEAGETALASAQRELREETGYTAKQWSFMGVLHPLISYSNEAIQVFLAQDLVAGEPHLDAGEFVETITMSLPELKAAALDGRITDGKTIAGILWLENNS